MKKEGNHLRNVIKLFFISCLLFVALDSQKAEGSTVFPDTKNYREEITFLTERGIIKGYANGNFGPNDSIKRIQAVQMILRELGVKTGDAPNPNFKDVKPGSYGYEEIAKAAQLGIISGKPDGNFDTYGKLTRGQMAKILVNAYQLKGTYMVDFKDVTSTDARLENIRALAAHSITTGYSDGTFRPNATLTRAHFALFMARLLNDDFKPYNTEKYNTEQMAVHAQSVVVIELYDDKDELVSQGSGFIVANQLIATNFHVISGGTKAVAITENGEEIVLEGVVDYDDYLDIAILKPSNKIGYPSLPLSNFDELKTGEQVVAIGSPYGLQNTVSQGIVSGTHIFEDEMGSVKAIQTTAEIGFGSSGGPLLNMKGFVVGLNSFGFDDINFAISTDYVSEMLVQYRQANFNQIPTEKFAEMPEINYEDDEFWEEEIINEEISDAGLLEGTKQTIADDFLDVVHDPELPVIYGINDYGELISVNYETKSIKRLSFSYPAESLAYHNGELFVTLLKGQHSSYWDEEEQEGAVAIVDAATFNIKKMFDIKLDPYDIVADGKYFYVASGSGQWTTLNSYDKQTGIEVSSKQIRQASSIYMHPNEDRIYAVDSDSSPRDIEVFSINNGQLVSSYDSPYHGDYDMLPELVISSDGKHIFNKAGTVFKATPLQATNMQFVTDLNRAFNDVAFNDEGTAFYLAVADQLYMYDYESFTPLAVYNMSGEGYYLFNHKGNLIIVGEEVSSKTGITKTFIMKTAMPAS